MKPRDAKLIKPQIQLAFVVVPQAPYYVSGSYNLGNITIDDPTDVTDTFKVLVGNIKCGLVTDGGNKVLAAFAAN